ncbi:putative orfan [Tupanvirus soda lake]|uniref:Orfan n=2 Tax=Tupanvirus TaxID=2094720 RepID=A0AC62ADU2_9VIRU|nr:putative orfan [Tupanvirus soda lake]QKU35820.1 putative orfan [Tupanvirus soda lake]
MAVTIDLVFKHIDINVVVLVGESCFVGDIKPDFHLRDGGVLCIETVASNVVLADDLDVVMLFQFVDDLDRTFLTTNSDIVVVGFFVVQCISDGTTIEVHSLAECAFVTNTIREQFAQCVDNEILLLLAYVYSLLKSYDRFL